MRFSPSFIERLRSHFLLSEIIGQRIALKKHGREYQALCPFHNEKSPSFTVNDEKNFFHCFGCGAHGDAIEFLMRHERLTYPETIEKLARDAGIPLPQETPEARQRAETEKTLAGVVEASCRWFEQQLAGAGGGQARDYLAGRGLTPETLAQFRIGYAPDERQALHKHLLAAGFSQALQAEAGVIIVPDDGPAYDRFRGRAIFPIRSARGAVVAFGGRLMAANANKNLPKYLNSPETPLFKKGEMLFNLDQAKRSARERGMAVVMEGYMDVVAAAQAGVTCAVATLGTAVTPEHLRLLWQLCPEPVLCLDGDAAGNRAMLRAAEIALPLLKPGQSLRFAVLPKGEDPDSYIKKHGRASFEKLLEMTKERPLSRILWETLVAQCKPQTPEGFAALEMKCRQASAMIADPIVRKQFEMELRDRLWEKRRKGSRTKAPPRSPHVEQMVVQHHSAAMESLTRRMLTTLMQFPVLLHKSQVEETLSHLDIKTAELDALRNALLSAIAEDGLDSREALASYLNGLLPGGVAGPVISPLPWRDAISVDDALRLWNETASAWEVAHLELELKALEAHVGQHMDDEAAYRRLVEITQALHKAQAARSFAPEETDVV